MPLRNPNDPVDARGAMQAIAAIIVPNTNLQAQGGAVYIDRWADLEQGSAQFPAVVLEQGIVTKRRAGWGVWQASLPVKMHYIDAWYQQPTTMDTIWANIDADLQRMIANLEDNANLTVNGVPNAVNIIRFELAPYPSTKDDRFAVPTVKRMVTLFLHTPIYRSAQ